MRILVTGAAGFIGFHVARRLLERGDSVVGIDSINSYYDPELKYARLRELGIGREAEGWGISVASSKFPEYRFIRMKIEDRTAMESLFRENAFDRVINLAAQAGVRYSIDHPHEYIDSNIVGFLNIIEGCRHGKVPHLVYASSSSVYGLNDTRPFSTHDHTDHPVSLYAATKKANELLAHAYSHLYGLPTTGLRFFTVYGPWGRPDMAYFKFAKAIMEGKPIDVYNNGDMWRDFTYIDDIVEGVVKVTEKAPETDSTWDSSKPDPSSSCAKYRIYNIGNSQPVNLTSFIETLEHAIGKKAIKNYLPIQQGDVLATEAEILNLKRDFNWSPSTTINIGLRKFVEWFIKWREGIHKNVSWNDRNNILTSI
jgi:UDP-glucuronate 4-epimerase